MDFANYQAMQDKELFNFKNFVKKPQIIMRLLCWLFSLVVMGCMVSQGYDKHGETIYGQDDNAYLFGVCVSALSFTCSMILLYGEARFMKIRQKLVRKHLILIDIALTAIFTILFVGTFFYLALAWSRRSPATIDSLFYGANNARASICFSLLAACAWAGSIYYSVQNYKKKVFEYSLEDFDRGLVSSAPYTSMPPGAMELASPSYATGGTFQYIPPKY